jgi:replicative DNA helicase
MDQMLPQSPNLPRSQEAERAVLGGLMMDPGQVLSVAENLNAEDFYKETHQRLYQLMVDMAGKNQPAEMVAVCERIGASGRPDDFGGLAYVAGLPDNVPSTANIDYYANVIRQRSIQRRLIFAAHQIGDAAHVSDTELAELMDFAEKTIFQVTQASDNKDWAYLSEVVDQEFERIQELSKNKGEVTGATTGYVDLDKILAGLHPTDLVVLAARPAMGKTALALNIAQNAAMKAGIGVGFFSLEMSRGQLATRMLCTQARVDAGKIRTGYLSREEDWPKLRDAAEDLYQLKVYIDDSPGLNITQLRSKARRLKTLDPSLRLIVVDYIGLMAGDPRVSRQEQVSASSRGLKALAKELEVTVMALSQLNRGVEQRPNKRPQMSDLRESGAIEQDADVIMFIYRDEYYNAETTTEPGVAEVIIAKQRNGSTGTVKLAFIGEHTRFDNLARLTDGYH